jgi:hypothetical protein
MLGMVRVVTMFGDLLRGDGERSGLTIEQATRLASPRAPTGTSMQASGGPLDDVRQDRAGVRLAAVVPLVRPLHL